MKDGYSVGTERYYQLKKYCKKYNEWANRYDSLEKAPDALCYRYIPGKGYKDPTALAIEARHKLLKKMKTISDLCDSFGQPLGSYLLMYITQEVPFEFFTEDIGDETLTKKEFYSAYRKFFYLLDKEVGKV